MTKAQKLLELINDDFVINDPGDSSDDGIEIEQILKELTATRDVTSKDNLSDLNGTKVENIRILKHTQGTKMEGIFFDLSEGKSIVVYAKVKSPNDFKITIGQRKN